MELVRQLDRRDYPAAARLLAEAFFGNPSHVYMCPDSKTRLAQLEWLLGGNLRMHVEADREASFCLGRDGVVDAMGFWMRPDGVELGLGSKIRAGLLVAPLRLGFGVVRRAVEIDTEVVRHRNEALGDRAYWYLNNLVVRDQLRGTGVGTRLLREQLDRVLEQGRDAAELPLRLRE